MKKNFQKLPKWLHSSVFYRARLGVDSAEYKKGMHKNNPMTVCHPFDANLVSSERADGKHNLMLDLDVQHEYIKSSTDGHAHLVINVPIEQKDMVELLEKLQTLGIIQKGFLDSTVDRGFSSLRLPGQDKDDPSENRWFYDGKDSTGSPDYKSTQHENLNDLTTKADHTVCSILFEDQS